jgi:hypothetical protein
MALLLLMATVSTTVHWQRMQRPAFTQLGVDVPDFLAGAELFSSTDARPNQDSLQQLPARAPPASIL